MVKIVSIENAPEQLKERYKSKKREFDPKLDEETIALLLKNFFLYADLLSFNKKEQMTLLGFNQMDYKTLSKMRNKKESKLFSWDTYNRIANFLGIIKSLKIIYPRNEELAFHWLDVNREIFNGKAAKTFLTEKPQESYTRIEAVRRILDLYRNGSINDVA